MIDAIDAAGWEGWHAMSQWDTATTATFVAALIAAAVSAGVGLATIAVTRSEGARSREWVGRDQSWTRWVWSIEKALSPSAQEREMGLAVMEALLDMEWMTADDLLMADAIGREIERRRQSQIAQGTAPTETES